MTDRLRTSTVADDAPHPNELEVVEVPLLLPGWQMSALEDAAHARGLTAAEMLRTVLREFINALPSATPSRTRAALADI